MHRVLDWLVTFKDNYLTWISLPKVGPIDIVEIIIICFLIYEIMVWIKDTRAWTLFKGLALIMVFIIIAAIFQMNTILWIAGKALNVGLIALAVIFQPELRSALEKLGRTRVFFRVFGNSNDAMRYSDKTINDTVKACFEMGKVKTGALIVMEKDIVLAEIEKTGIPVDAMVSSQLYINIFEKNTPLHDGAVLVRGDRIVSATCYLPLTDSLIVDKELGTRHRAALGISEVSDSITVIVSEETGAVSVAMDGKIYRGLTPDTLRDYLKSLQGQDKIAKGRRRAKNVEKNS